LKRRSNKLLLIKKLHLAPWTANEDLTVAFTGPINHYAIDALARVTAATAEPDCNLTGTLKRTEGAERYVNWLTL